MALRWSQEHAIRDAVRSHDAKALHEAIDNLPRYDRDFQDVRRAIEDAGGSRLVRGDRIELWDPSDGVTTVRDRYGEAYSEHDMY